MSEANRTRPVNTTPEAHWYTHDPAAEPSPHELVISEAQAVSEALSTLGRDAPITEVCRLLRERGLDVKEETIEHVRAELCQPGPRPC